MKPRIPLESDGLSSIGLPKTTSMAPLLSKARGNLAKTARRMGEVDPVTTELVRFRNARFQSCYF